MTKAPPLAVLSIAHGAVRGDLGRIRYRAFVGRDEIAVELVAPSRWREYGRLMDAEPLSSHDVPLHVEPIRFPYLPAIKWYAHYYPRLSQIISRARPDVIHLWEEPWSLVALQAARLRGPAALVLEVDQNILKSLPPPFQQIRRYVLQRTDVILARSHEAESVVRECGFRGPVFPIGYGVDQHLFHPPVDRHDKKRGEVLRIGYVGRVCEEKGLDDALDAVATAQCKAELVIMGEGPYEARIRERIGELGLADRVTIEGWRGLDAVADVFRGLDVSVLLSRATSSWKEQFGRTIIESQSCGVPVIGSNSGAIPDIVGAGGWIVAERDPSGVARILERISREPGELAEKRAASLTNVNERFTYSITAQRLETAWRAADRVRKAGLQGAGYEIETRPASSAQSAGTAAMREQTDGFRIVQVVRDMVEGGGVETVAFQLARAWKKADIDNLTIARNYGPPDSANLRVERVAQVLEKLPTRGAYRYVGRTIVVPIFTLAATWALRRHRDAIVLSHGDSLTGDVLVVHAVNAASIDAKKQAGLWKWRLNPLHVWVALRDRYMVGGLRYRQFVAVSPRAGRELQQHYGVPQDRISVIPNGIDLARFKPDEAARNRIREEFGFSAEDQLMLFVGHEFARKGLAHVISALEKLPDDVKLLVVGSDTRAPYERLYTGAADRLVFAGERLDMPALYAAVDAFVLPSQYETFALVGMEAMACGVPVFATRVGGIEDYLQDGVNGFSVEANGADIAEKVARVFDDPKRLAELSHGARVTAQAYGWPAIAARYAQFLEKVWREKHRMPAPAAGRTDGAISVSRIGVTPGE